MFSTSDDSAMMKQVQSTHAPDGREIDVKPLIQIVDEILIQIIARSVEGHEHVTNTLKCTHITYDICSKLLLWFTYGSCDR